MSYRDLAEIVWELGVLVAPSTILRGVVRYSEEFAKCWRTFETGVGRSWRADETYVKVRGKWMYWYRAVDQHGKTVESYLSRTRDMAAAKAFFRKALKLHGEPRTITLDGFEPSHGVFPNKRHFCFLGFPAKSFAPLVEPDFSPPPFSPARNP